jgi:hypothetical protein
LLAAKPTLIHACPESISVETVLAEKRAVTDALQHIKASRLPFPAWPVKIKIPLYKKFALLMFAPIAGDGKFARWHLEFSGKLICISLMEFV